MIRSSLKLRSALSDLDPKKIEQKIKSLELAEKRALKAAEKLLEAQGLRKAKAEVKELIEVTLEEAKANNQAAQNLRNEAEEALASARAKLTENKIHATALADRERELDKLAKKLEVERGEVAGIRRSAERDAEQAIASRKEYELKLANIKNRLAGL